MVFSMVISQKTAPQGQEPDRARRRRMLAEGEELVAFYPRATCSLDYTTPFELVVATVLSAQTTDKRVNVVTKELFARWPTPQALAAALLEDVEAVIRPLGFFRIKALHIVGLSRELVERFGGVVPRTMEELTTLPGVGRKTANVVLGDAFGVPGFPVDTHVTRVTGRLRWTDQWRSAHPDPVRIEKQVTAVFPPQEWAGMSHRLIYLGREICHPRHPACADCPLAATCPSAGME